MSKYGAKKVKYDGITFDSAMESEFYKLLIKRRNSGEIKFFELQPSFELQPKFEKDGVKYRSIDYIADFMVINNDDSVEIIDIKGFSTHEFNLKKKIFNYKYEYTLKLIAYSQIDGGWVDIDKLKKARKSRKATKDAEKAVKLKEQQLREATYMDVKSLASVEYIAKDIEMSDRTRKSFIKYIKENYQTIELLKLADEKDMHRTYKNKIKQLQNLIY